MPYYLYSDASIKSVNNNSTQYAYIGGMITDDTGKIIFSFFDKIQDKSGFKCSHIDYAEAVALETGLTHATEMGIKNIKCYTDSRHCVEAIQNFQFNTTKSAKERNKLLLKRIPVAYKEKQTEKILDIIAIGEEFFETFETQHIVRKKNQYADNMSNYLRIFEKGTKTERKKFKQMLKTSVIYACEYDFIEEHKAHKHEELKLHTERKRERKLKVLPATI